MPGLCAGRVVAITGAGRGIGREHALLFAKEGAKVVVNDLGAGTNDMNQDTKVADEVVAEIKKMGGEAVAHYEDCSSMSGGQSLIDIGVKTFGGFDTLICNAGILRDKTLINMSESDWDSIMQVHLKGTFAPTKAALEYWRKCAQDGKPRKGRIVNTSSGSGLVGNFGQVNYGAAKAALATMAFVTNAEVERMGIRVNCIAPGARTRMTIPLGGAVAKEVEEGKFDEFHPRNMSPTVVWLGSDACEVGGAILSVSGRKITVMQGWTEGKSAKKEQTLWEPSELTNVIPKIVADSQQHRMYEQMAAMAKARAKRAKAKAKL